MFVFREIFFLSSSVNKESCLHGFEYKKTCERERKLNKLRLVNQIKKVIFSE
jgi:hypothetical protein